MLIFSRLFCSHYPNNLLITVKIAVINRFPQVFNIP